MINVAIIEDHMLLANTLSFYLKNQQNINVVSVNNDANSFLQIVESKNIDVALIDVELPEIDGIELCGMIKKNYSHIKIVGYSLHDSKPYFEMMTNQGAEAYVLKYDNTEEITNAIYAVNANLNYYSQGVFHLLKKSDAILNNKNILSTRQIEIANLIADGSSTKKIATVLNISEATISTHRNNIMKKLNVHNVAGIIRYISRLNIK